MADIERNDPCSCGSGKKYKKCCLIKHRQEEIESTTSVRNFENDYFEDELNNDGIATNSFFDASGLDNEYDEEYNEEFDEEYDGDEDDTALYKKLNIKSISDDIPEISDEEEAIVDEWWEQYPKMGNPDDIRAHLETFFTNHPKLVLNLELQYEVLFELGADYIKQNRHKEYIDLLLKVRSDFPDTFLKSYGYFDRDIISYKLFTNSKSDIPGLLDYFKEYPDHDPDNLFKIIDTLIMTNCQDILIPFIEEIYYPVYLSPKLYGGDKIVNLLILSYYSPYLKKGFSENNLTELSIKLKEIKIKLDDAIYQPEYWKNKFSLILDDFTNWEIKDCKNNKDIYIRYHEVSLNFMGFLKENRDIDWIAASYYSQMISIYLMEVIPAGKRPKAGEPFIFTKDSIDKTIVQTCKDFLWIDCTKSIGILNAIYYFADYLLQTNNIDEEKRSKIQGWCKELFEKLYRILKKQSFEAILFNKFPFI